MGKRVWVDILVLYFFNGEIKVGKLDLLIKKKRKKNGSRQESNLYSLFYYPEKLKPIVSEQTRSQDSIMIKQGSND